MIELLRREMSGGKAMLSYGPTNKICDVIRGEKLYSKNY